jgi:glucose/mannose-6-phosphate isomerase
MQLLDNLSAIQRVDRSSMLKRACALAQECRQGWQMGLHWSAFSHAHRRASGLAVVGMGGSAIGADLIQGILREGATRPIWVNRTYTVSRWMGRNILVLACSYSGNTEETLTASKQAYQNGAHVAAITSGGQLAEWARRKGIPLLIIPSGLPPRSALGYLAMAPLGLLVRLGWVRLNEDVVERSCQALDRAIATQFSPSIPVSDNPAKRLAIQLKGRLPILYGASGGWEGVTYRWRTQLEENAKTLAFHHIFPEATHNEISGWLEPKGLMRRLIALFFNDPAMHPKILRRMEFTDGIVRGQGAKTIRISMPGRSFLERLLKLTALGDFTSIYLGILYRHDPTPVHRVEDLKAYLKSR